MVGPALRQGEFRVDEDAIVNLQRHWNIVCSGCYTDSSSFKADIDRCVDLFGASNRHVRIDQPTPLILEVELTIISITDCTPYLLSLGLTKSKTSLVWIAGPLSGLIVQPIVGVIADESKSKWGRRRPFIMAGAVVSGLCLLTLGFTKEIVSFFIPDETAAKSLTVFTAVLAIYAVDFAVNVGTL